MRLRDLQQSFFNTVVHRQADDALLSAVKTSGSLSQLQRLQIHQNNFSLSLQDALVGDFPCVEAFVGREFLTAVLRAFVRAHPPETAILADYGFRLPSFWRQFSPCEDVAYLADLLALELGIGQVALMDCMAALAVDDYTALISNSAVSERVTPKLTPHHIYIKSASPLFSLWLAAKGQVQAEDIDLAQGGEHVIAFKRDGEVLVFAPSAVEQALFERLTAQTENSERLTVEPTTLAECISDQQMGAAVLSFVEKGLIQEVKDEL